MRLEIPSLSNVNAASPIDYLNKRYATWPVGSCMEQVEMPSEMFTPASPAIDAMIDRIKADAKQKGLVFKTLVSISELDARALTRRIVYTADKEKSMAHEAALVIVNTMKQQMTAVARAVADATKDGKVTPMEGMLLGMQGMQFATTVITLFAHNDAELTADVLYVLEHGSVALSE